MQKIIEEIRKIKLLTKDFHKFIILDVVYIIITYLLLPLYNENNKPMDQFHISFYILMFVDSIVVILSFILLVHFLIRNYNSLKKIIAALILNLHIFYWLVVYIKK